MTTTFVGLELRSVTVRWPMDRLNTAQLPSVDSTTEFQSFVTVA